MEREWVWRKSVNTVRSCVYCGRGTDLTNEHVIPECYHEASGETISIVQTPTEDKAIPNPQEIGDVCATCNSGPLSRLDSYFAALNKEYFAAIVYPGDRIRFRYDLDLLLRFMLKIGYNVARTRKWPLQIFQEARAFILGKEPCPSGFRIFLQLLIPTPAKKTNLPMTPGTREVPPLLWRADLYDVSSFPGFVFAGSISFMSYRFFILREDMNVPATIRKQSVTRWLKGNKGASELTRRGDATVYASSVTVLDALNGNPTFERQLAKARKLKAEMELKRKPRNS
jgi:hypothetical protein